MILIVTDTHLGLQKSADLWHDVTTKLFQEIRDTCVRNNITTIIHLGDFFHERKSTNTKTLNVAYDIIRMLEGIDIHILAGNHDIFYKDRIRPSSLESLEQYDNVHVVYEPTYMAEINSLLVPWVFKRIDMPTGCKYCFGHLELTGFNMNTSFKCEKGTDSSIFSEFQSVYSGHFHTPSQQGNIRYLGSPFQQTFHDVGSQRGYYLFEPATNELDFIQFKSSPKYVIQHTENDTHDIEGNIVKLIFDKDYGLARNTKIVEEIMALKPLKISTNFANITEEDEVSDHNYELLDHKDITIDYIKSATIPEHLNSKTLTNMMIKIIEEGGGK
jgi:DNA repair exonuclease SbcCD nuclease subunit